MRVCALVTDLMDRSKISAAVTGAEFVREAGACAGADVVIIDIVRFGADVGAVRALLPAARLVCFGPHVDDAGAAAASAAGADAVLPRSQFFRDPAAAVGG